MRDPVRGNRRTLYLLIVLFFLPVATAFCLYYGANWRPLGQTNHGELITPTRALPAEATALRGKWSLVYIGNGRCDEACRNALIFGRQTRLSLNQDMKRVARVFLVTGDCCDRAYLSTVQAGLEVVEVADPANSALLAAFPATDRANSLYIVDPLGNLVMRYDVRQSPNGLLSDLQKLLKLSHIG
jgi:hypothetical protein